MVQELQRCVFVGGGGGDEKINPQTLALYDNPNQISKTVAITNSPNLTGGRNGWPQKSTQGEATDVLDGFFSESLS